MISPKYSTTHYFYPAVEFAASATSAVAAPHTVNFYLDYNCPFSAKIFFKLKDQVIPQLAREFPKKFQFVFVNVIQPWHPNSNLLHEFSLVVAKLLRETAPSGFTDPNVSTNSLFWELSALIFNNKEQFFDEANVHLNRNEIYESIANLPGFEDLGLPFSKEAILEELKIVGVADPKESHNHGNGATLDVKYFTKYLRGVGVHVTPTLSVDGITNLTIQSSDEIETIVKTLGSATA